MSFKVQCISFVKGFDVAMLHVVCTGNKDHPAASAGSEPLHHTPWLAEVSLSITGGLVDGPVDDRLNFFFIASQSNQRTDKARALCRRAERSR